MKKKISKASEAKRQFKLAKSIRLILAAYILVIMLLQLFTFENFPSLISLFGVGQSGQYMIVIVLVLLELAALPFLIDINTRVGAINFSFAAGIGMMMLLTLVEVSAYYAGQTAMFGATFDLPSGSWSLLFLAAMWVLFAWSSWYLLKDSAKSPIVKS